MTEIAMPDDADDQIQGALVERFIRTRQQSIKLSSRLGPEDMVAQSMPDASPAKWHLAHTTWFFETFLLKDRLPGYVLFDESYSYLFNSYYEAVGARQPRHQRGLMTRPSVGDVFAYRRYVDEHMSKLLTRNDSADIESVLQVGIAHEEQHQELLLMDILHLFSQSYLKPVFDQGWKEPEQDRVGQFKAMPGGIVEIGARTDGGFHFDNESPRHKTYLQAFEISDRLVTQGEWLAFMDDGGYRRPELWLADGWAHIQKEGWEAPEYWERSELGWQKMTLAGVRKIVDSEPVRHVSYFEANAYARWAGARLPTEAEWENASEDESLKQLYGVAWQWTSSAYSEYPGYRPVDGALGEYNGKFMVSQMVLRGGADITSAGHTRSTYRNFFYPQQRWMASGVRLSREPQDAVLS